MLLNDGPWKYSDDIGKIFKHKGVEGQASFFINGNNYGCIYDDAIVKSIRRRFDEGFEFGSLTWGHTNVVNLTFAQLVRQLELLETAITKILGVRLGMFVAPYDSLDDKAAKIIREKGYKIVRWSLDSGDTTTNMAHPQGSIKLIRKWIKEASGKSAIGLFDETKRDTVHKVLPQSINILKKHGYKLVTVSECLGIEPYQPGRYVRSERDETWTCELRY
ncbi:BQ2448_3635 [Microbotryum intermedium]|uniref:BQ2448_3635 protein n=1 Tax=Microbotryum intermedium TaxID=269621 RepID=A0A238FFT6_9BASI|nr:BQ2448_3635 [Microbotryum intermedium]